MAGFIRRYSYSPGSEIISQIEGAVIVDLAPPGSIQGAGVGVVAMVGEFADMSYGVAVDSVGAVTTSPRPVEVTSAQDMIDKVGGWDETLGDFSASGGNAFALLRGKKFSRLVCVPVNFASSAGIRLFRDLPTNVSATNASPVVPLSAASVVAGREFKSSANRVRTCAKVTFLNLADICHGIDGSVTSTGSAASHIFTSAGGAFIASGVQKGDVLVVGVIGAAGAQGANAATYRVKSVDLATQLTVELMTGANFDWSSGTGQAWRVHPGRAADSAVGSFSAADAGGYAIPARPLDVTIAAATAIVPTVVPAAATATGWDPLSGLGARTIPVTGLVYTAAVQAPNAASTSAIQVLYATAIDKLLTDELPQREVNILVSARLDSVIRAKCKAHVLSASSQGVGRMAVISPEINSVTLATELGDADPGVGVNRNERVLYAWPGEKTLVPEAVGFSVETDSATLTTDGILDLPAHARLASLLSILAPERNPGQASPPVPEAMATILGFQRSAPALQINDYILMRQKGIVGLRNDKTAGFIFQSGVTTSLTSGEKNINRRRMADFIEDSASQRLVQFAKQPLTQSLKDAMAGELDAFLAGLLSENNPPAQRISGYLIDTKSGNTADLEAAGIHVIIAKVRTLATADFIVVQVEAGEGVVVTAT